MKWVFFSFRPTLFFKCLLPQPNRSEFCWFCFTTANGVFSYTVFVYFGSWEFSEQWWILNPNTWFLNIEVCMSLLSLHPVIHCKEGRAGVLSPAMGFPSLRALDEQLLVGAHNQKLQRWIASRKNKCLECLSRERKKKRRGICNQNFTAGIVETQLQNHHLLFKVFPRSSTEPECQKNSQWKKINSKNQKWTHSPKSHPQNTPNTDKHTQNPKKEKRKKKWKNRQRTKNTQQTSYCYSLEFLLKSKPQREEKKQPKTSQRHTETEQELQLGALDL